MPPKVQRAKKANSSGKRSKAVKGLPLNLLCEWIDCTDTFANMKEYIEHIQTHLFDVFNSCKEEDGNYNDIMCQWRECGHEMGRNFVELVRHVYFHSFHTKIKSLGSNLVQDKGFEPCMLDSTSRNTVPELTDRLHCGWSSCDYIYDNPELFYAHVSIHVNIYADGNNVEGGVKCEWEGCDSIFKSKHKLREHLRSHTQEKVVACPTCGSLFSSNTKFVDHLNRQCTLQVQHYQCSHCNKKFSTERLLRDHMRHHVNHYKCPLCDMTCPCPSSLRAHIKHRHTDDRAFKCPNCPMRFHMASDLRRHQETHNSTIYKCHIESCPYQCHNYNSLSRHFKHAHQGVEVEKFCCHICPASFTRGNSLTCHLKKKHKFKWPSGHRRFRYKLHNDGCFRLQTIRYESIELNEQILTDTPGDGDPNPDPGQGPSTSEDRAVTTSTRKTPTKDGSTAVMKTPIKEFSLRRTPNKDQGGRKPPINAVVIAPHVEEDWESGSENSPDHSDSPRKRTPKKSSYSYNLEMLGEVALSEQKGKGKKRKTPPRCVARKVAKKIIMDDSETEKKVPRKKKGKKASKKKLNVRSEWSSSEDENNERTERIISRGGQCGMPADKNKDIPQQDSMIFIGAGNDPSAADLAPVGQILHRVTSPLSSPPKLTPNASPVKRAELTSVNFRQKSPRKTPHVPLLDMPQMLTYSYQSQDGTTAVSDYGDGQQISQGARVIGQIIEGDHVAHHQVVISQAEDDINPMNSPFKTLKVVEMFTDEPTGIVHEYPILGDERTVNAGQQVLEYY